ncbi:hypothetical protein HHK36_005403 [Tetracentron sinense]|uniref:Helicase-like transcription factor CHR28 n=1 Tax=Tetracentron sinense TaxID=13715 RepID=A0A834ZQA2_TETSI|nr:hypothetical protein HHK36_005403 [Tetracentron sinense]
MEFSSLCRNSDLCLLQFQADDSSTRWLGDDFSASDDSDEFSIDIDSLYAILESPDPLIDPLQANNLRFDLQCSPEDLSCKNIFQGKSAPDAVNHEDSQHQNGIQESEGAPLVREEVLGSPICYPSEYLEPLDSRTGMGSECLFESPGDCGMVLDYGKLESSAQIRSPVHSYSLSNWIPLEHDTCSRERDGVSENALLHRSIGTKGLHNQMPNCSTIISFAAGDTNHVSDRTENVNLSHFKSETEDEFMNVGGDLLSKCASPYAMLDKSDLIFGTCNAISGSSLVPLGALERSSCTSPMEASFMDADISLQNALHTELNCNQVSDIIGDASYHCSALPSCIQSSMGADNAFLADHSIEFLPDTFNLPFISSNEEKMFCIKDEVDELLTGNVFTGSKTNLRAQEGRRGMSVPEVTMMDYTDVNSCQGTNFKCEVDFLSSISRNSSSNAYDFADKAPRHLLPAIRSFMSSNKQVVRVKDERKDALLELKSPCYHSEEVINETVSDLDADDGPFAYKVSRQLLPGTQSFMSGKKQVVQVKDEGEDELLASKNTFHSVQVVDKAASRNPTPVTDYRQSADHAARQLLPGIQPFTSNKKQIVCIKDEGEVKLLPPRSMTNAVESNPLGNRPYVDDDADICILEDISDPVDSPSSVMHGKSLIMSQHSAFSDPPHLTEMGGIWLKENDERLTYRAALQDLSQPKSEASPPDGVLAVPLLRHQRIALSWMVQKETTSLHCSGGILADDQGLGKTVSTIALILKERSPSSKVNTMAIKQGDSEALNLDEEDDGVPELAEMKQDGDSGHVMVNRRSIKTENAFILAKGRPAAGTLVVCPTSVLRQWDEELHNKVTSKADLSVLVYHGSNRTKDPNELAKYDVVLTTYAIVSMEVPKQPLVDNDDDEKGKTEAHGLPLMEFSSSRKRKYPPSSVRKSLKGKKGMDGAFLDSVARPLARVGWFRVVLDEAQSIKNHRTQVARACWGLRAKRRWCLSGTPIQNAVDDLYSYFRFLRYDPYAVYKSFCSMVKVPINRNPTNGYKKLQAVLKTIMLRRTKGTLLDGEPIITLPPKSIELKKVEFSKEERDFYSRLEADSRAQFKAYAAADTVNQNYVNILLMLLRLRQACDHPLLVRGYDSNSVWRSSVEMARKLPREEQMGLLDCLEADLAICGICNDPPEDAVVAICRHVFCNQCICEHLTGDDTVCPTSHCKHQLSVNSVFSRATLKSSLSDQPGHDCSLDTSGSELVETLEPPSEGVTSDSSKIKTALEVLQALSKHGDCTSKDSSLRSSDEVAGCPENMSDSPSGESVKDMSEKRNAVVDKGLYDLKTKVAEKAIVFSQWTRMLDLLEARLKNSSIRYRRLDGTMSIVARDKAVKDFNTRPEVSVMIMSLKAASLGLNMVAACHVLLLDLWWNPTTEDQAIDRAHRIGQTRPVTVLRLTVKDTVEDRILALQQKKREMVASAFGEDETGSRQTRLTVEDLKYLFMV